MHNQIATMNNRMLNRARRVLDTNIRRYARLRCPPVITRPQTGTVYLTFDDGPHPLFTPHITKILEAHGHRATFFCIGRLALRHKDLLRDMHKAGHAIGSHSSNHLKQWESSSEDVLSDYETGHNEVEEAIGNTTELFRPPYGHHDLRSCKFSLRTGYRPILWNCDSYDWREDATEDSIMNLIEPSLQPGSIILLHDHIFDNPAAQNREQTVAAVKGIVALLHQRSLKSEALAL